MEIEAQKLLALQEKFLNDLKQVADLANNTYVLNNSSSCPTLNAFEDYKLAFSLDSDLLCRYYKYFNDNQEKLNKLETRKDELKILQDKLNTQFSQVLISSNTLSERSPFYTNIIFYNQNPIYEYITNDKQNTSEIIKNAYLFMTNIEKSPNFAVTMKLLNKIEKIKSKYNNQSMPKHTKSHLDKLENKVYEIPSNNLFKKYFTMKDHKDMILDYKESLEELKYHGKSYIDYINEINSIENKLSYGKNRLLSDLDEATKCYFSLKLINVFKNNLDYIYYFSEKHSADVFESLLLKSGYFNESVINYFNSKRLLRNFANELKKFEIAENFYNDNKNNYDNWCPVSDLDFINSLKGKDIPDYVKIEGTNVYINTAKAPFDKLSADLQYKDFKDIEVIEKHIQKGEEE